jgi:hypothetical protein
MYINIELMHIIDLKHLALTSISCFALHHLLLSHHITTCQQTFFSVFLSDSAYCRFVWGILRGLQWMPIFMAGPLLSYGPDIRFPYIPRRYGRNEEHARQSEPVYDDTRDEHSDTDSAESTEPISTRVTRSTESNHSVHSLSRPTTRLTRSTRATSRSSSNLTDRLD